MPTTLIAEAPVDVDAEGFLTKPEQWNEQIAEAIARDNGIAKGSLEGIYPGLIMANGARMDGIEAEVFFTFFGLDAIRRNRQGKIKVATVGNPALHLPTLLGALPGFSALATKMMQRQMEKL